MPMKTLSLTSEEQQLLVEVLDATVSDLGMEIADTDQKDYREGLKKRKMVLMKILQSLQ
jgi:hypothetical protein